MSIIKSFSLYTQQWYTHNPWYFLYDIIRDYLIFQLILLISFLYVKTHVIKCNLCVSYENERVITWLTGNGKK